MKKKDWIDRETQHCGQGYEGNYGNLRPTAFQKKLEEDPLTAARAQALCPPIRATKTTAKIPEPAGYVQPHQWNQLWIHRDHPERILLATATGWEPIDALELRDGVKRIQVTDDHGNLVWERGGVPKMQSIPWEHVVQGVVHFHGTRLEEIGLVSIRMPDPGKRELRHG